MRHEVPRHVPDPFLFVERNGGRHVVISSLEIPVLGGLGLEFHPYEDYGFDDLRRGGMASRDASEEVALRALDALGVTDATVPATFPVLLADKMRERGIEVTAHRTGFEQR